MYGLSTIIARLLNFVLTPIYTRVYAPAVYGIVTNLYAWVSLLNAVLAFGMETTFFRYVNKYEDKARVYNNTFFAILFISFVFLSCIFLFIDPLSAWIHDGSTASVQDYKTFILIFSCILVVDAVAVIPFAKLRADGRPMRYSVLKLVNIITFVSFNLIFLFVIPWLIERHLLTDALSWFRPGWVGYVFLSNLIANALTLLMLLPELLKLSLAFDTKLLKEMTVYSLPILIANLSFIVNETSDKIFVREIIGGELGDHEAGIYGAVAKIAIFLSIFIQSFRLGAEPFFFSHSGNKNSGQTYSTIMNYFVIAVSLIFVGLVANLEILKYFIDDSYWTGLKVVPVLLFGYVSLGIYMNLSIWYKLSDQTRYGLYISGIGAILTIVLNILFIPEYSYVASAWVSLLAYTSMMILSYLWGQKNYPIPYNIKKNLAYLIASVILVILSFVVFKRNLIIGNLLFIAFAGASFYFERKNLKLILASK